MDAIERSVRSGEIGPNGEIPEFLKLCSVVNGRAVNEARKRRRRQVADIDPGYDHFPASDVDPETRTASADQLAFLVREVRERFAEDAPVLGILTAVLDGVDKPAQQAARLGFSIEELRKAIRRLRGFLRQHSELACLALTEDDDAS